MSHHEADQEKVHIGQVLTKIEELERKIDSILSVIEERDNKERMTKLPKSYYDWADNEFDRRFGSILAENLTSSVTSSACAQPQSSTKPSHICQECYDLGWYTVFCSHIIEAKIKELTDRVEKLEMQE